MLIDALQLNSENIETAIECARIYENINQWKWWSYNEWLPTAKVKIISQCVYYYNTYSGMTYALIWKKIVVVFTLSFVENNWTHNFNGFMIILMMSLWLFLGEHCNNNWNVVMMSLEAYFTVLRMERICANVLCQTKKKNQYIFSQL